MASRLYEYCLMRWQSGAWGEEQLTNAVQKGYITEEEKQDIMTHPQQTT
ncbi:XkdX family protein [Brevibacillus agri]|nr:XkdX family protein [Brevibacillus agri]MDN4093588.1 XkdX family protein [Brevibacillus agri]